MCRPLHKSNDKPNKQAFHFFFGETIPFINKINNNSTNVNKSKKLVTYIYVHTQLLYHNYTLIKNIT